MKTLLAIAFVFVFVCGYIFTHPGSTTSAATQPQLSPTFSTPDEAGALMQVCGAPGKDLQESADAFGAGFRKRYVEYSKIEFQFGLDPQRHENWTMMGAFREYGSDSALSRREAAKLMPCVAKVQFSNDLF